MSRAKRFGEGQPCQAKLDARVDLWVGVEYVRPGRRVGWHDVLFTTAGGTRIQCPVPSRRIRAVSPTPRVTPTVPTAPSASVYSGNDDEVVAYLLRNPGATEAAVRSELRAQHGHSSALDAAIADGRVILRNFKLYLT